MRKRTTASLHWFELAVACLWDQMNSILILFQYPHIIFSYYPNQFYNSNQFYKRMRTISSDHKHPFPFLSNIPSNKSFFFLRGSHQGPGMQLSKAPREKIIIILSKAKAPKERILQKGLCRKGSADFAQPPAAQRISLCGGGGEIPALSIVPRYSLARSPANKWWWW